jgi:hypothetical protein
MSREPNESQPAENTDPTRLDPNAAVAERVQELTWALVDEQISTDEMRLLDNLLLSDDGARESYIRCVQLHTDLMNHYRKPASKSAPRTGKSLVLGFLSDSLPAIGLDSPRSEDVRS